MQISLSCVIVLLSLIGCQPTGLMPVDITTEDMCASCKMAISEKRYAAEFLTKDGEPVKFDDLACLVRYVRTRQPTGTVAAFYVVDFETRQWLRAEDAQYVRSPQFKTPMSGGIVAFKDEASAAVAAARTRGTRLRFADLFG